MELDGSLMTMQNGSSGGMFGGENFLKELFAIEPRLGFFGELQKQNFSPNQRQYFRSQFQPFQNRFMGNTANFLQGGGNLKEAPSFSDFLDKIDFNQEFLSMAPSQRPGGMNRGRFSPPTRFLF